MAFTGAATLLQITDRCVRITGLSLAAGAAGVIGLFGSGLEVALPDSFNPKPTTYEGVAVPVTASVRCDVYRAAGTAATATPIATVKTSPAGVFTLTLTNTDGAAVSGALEIYVYFD